MMNYILAPSILAADFKVLGQEQMKRQRENGAAYFILMLWMECLYQVYRLECRF